MAALLAVPAAAGEPFSFAVSLESQCASGSGPSGARLIVSLRTSEGALRSRITVETDADGQWFGCFALPVHGGNRIKAATGGRSRVWSIPDVQPRVNRVSDVVSGRAQPGDRIDLLVLHATGFDDGFFGGGEYYERVATTDAQGRYRSDFTSEVDVIGSDLVFASLQDGRDSVEAFAFAPFLVLTRNDSAVFGAANYGDDATLSLSDAAGDLKGRAYAGPGTDGFFDAQFRRADGSAAEVLVGDRVTGTYAGDLSVTMPEIDVRGEASTDLVVGRCMPNTPYFLSVQEGDFGFNDASFRGTTRSDGTFAKDLTGKFFLQRGDQLELFCRFDSGDYVSANGDVGR